MAKDIIIKPVISEKADQLAAKSRKYTFIVDKSANRLQIKEALKVMFPEVTISDVNTSIQPGKAKTRNTKSGVLKGFTSPTKKAVVTLAEGDELDIYGSEL